MFYRESGGEQVVSRKAMGWRMRLRKAWVLAIASLLASFGVVAVSAGPAAASGVVWVQTWGSYGYDGGQVDDGVTNPYTCYFVNSYPAAVGCDFGGVLNPGRNYVYCKVWGHQAGWSDWVYNHWWLKTDVDRMYDSAHHNPLWVSAYYLTGGKNSANDTAFDVNGREIPNC